MNLFVKFLLLIGATFCVAPIFSVVQAQQSGNEARMLLQMQDMQAEIAELRDMVERQQFQLQRMQRKFEQTEFNTTRPSDVSPNAQPTIIGTVPQVASNLPQSTSVSDNDTLADDEKWLFNGATRAEAYPPEQTVDRSAPANADDNVYSVPPPELTPADAAGKIEDRDIVAPPLPQSGSNASYPPVEDRSIGAGNSPSKAVSPSTQRVDPVSTLPRIPPSAPIPAGTIDARQIPSEPVIGVPDLSDTTSTDPQATERGSRLLRPAVGSSVIPEQEYYQQGVNLVKQSKFKDAIQMFQQLIANHPNGSLSGDAYYWIGEAGFLDRDLATSKQNFRIFMDNYPQSSRVPGAMLRTAYIEQEQGNLIEARILLNEIIQYHPGADAVHAAKNRLAVLESKSN